MMLTFKDSEEYLVNKVLEVVEDDPTMEYIPKFHSRFVLTFPGLEILIQELIVYHNNTLIRLTYYEFFTLL